MRSTIALLLTLGLGIAGCDTPKPAEPQATGAVTGETPAAAQDSAGGKLAGQGTTRNLDHKGEAAPAHSFLDPDGKPVTLAAFQGKPLLVNLWATWCAPCIREMPTLDRLAVREAGKLQVLVISQDMDGMDKVGPFFAKANYQALKPYLDPDLQFSTGYGVNLPTTILYDAQGKEVWRVSGDVEWDGEEAAEWIKAAG